MPATDAAHWRKAYSFKHLRTVWTDYSSVRNSLPNRCHHDNRLQFPDMWQRVLFDVDFATDVSVGVADVAVLRASRRAMATLFEVLLPFGLPNAQVVVEAALDRIDELEDQLTVFRDHSEVSQLNAKAFDGGIQVERGLFDLIEFAAHVTRQTQGAFDIATGALTKTWGFFKREGRVPTLAERADVMGRTGTRFLALDRELRSVRYLRKGLEINLGGIGKGYALDRTAELLTTEWHVASALLHGGASSVRAIGTPPGQPRGWPVTIKHPWESDRRLGTVYLDGVALGTSAATFQHFAYNGRTLGHLLDPRTGWPAEGIQQTSVIAPTAMEADALSTAFFVLGVEPTAEFCRSRPEIGVVLLPAGQDRPLTFNLNSQTYSPAPPG
ncbi:MAG TPA: FAD:protein FMN transferase [Gemmataceae bacterium]|nr:FAD:protein FMN transferase [Gemmataceae bacterium]